MAEAPVKRVYVPSVIEEEQGPIGLGCFSEEATAWRVLRAFLRETERMRLSAPASWLGTSTSSAKTA